MATLSSFRPTGQHALHSHVTDWMIDSIRFDYDCSSQHRRSEADLIKVFLARRMEHLLLICRPGARGASQNSFELF